MTVFRGGRTVIDVAKLDWNDPEAVKAYKRERYYVHAEEYRAKYRKNRKKLTKYAREWIAARPGYRREWQLLRLYGLTGVEFDRMLERQRGACAICRVPQAKSARFHVDHKGATLRGLLCASCNGYVSRRWKRKIPNDSPVLQGWPYKKRPPGTVSRYITRK